MILILNFFQLYKNGLLKRNKKGARMKISAKNTKQKNNTNILMIHYQKMLLKPVLNDLLYHCNGLKVDVPEIFL